MKQILGTMTFAGQVDESAALEMLAQFEKSGNRELDTAYQYCSGDTEKLLGKISQSNSSFDFPIATKINPWEEEGLKPESMRLQFDTSLDRLATESVDMLYLHAPDSRTPIADSLEVLWDYYQQGKFKRFALSNFAAWQVAEVVELCRSRNWMTPVVYQGLYNALNRDVEAELFSCLRNYGISFYAYNPLAGGMLTGKHKAFSDAPSSGRFNDNEAYQSRYWKKDYFAALEKFSEQCRIENITPTAAALRWLCHHSSMSNDHGDGIILGASKLNHLNENLVAVNAGPLPDSILSALDKGWELVKGDCYRYFRN